MPGSVLDMMTWHDMMTWCNMTCYRRHAYQVKSGRGTLFDLIKVFSNQTLRIDRGSLSGALHLGRSIQNCDSCNSILYIV